MKVFPTRNALLRTVGSALAFTVVLAAFLLLATVSTLWGWIVAVTVMLSLSAKFVLSHESTQAKLAVTAKRIRRWSYGHHIQMSSGALLLSAISLSLFGASAWKGNELPKAIECDQAAISQAMRSTVLIEGKEGTGSGFWISPTIVATNNHVVDHNPDLLVNKRIPATVLATDSLRDVALLRVVGMYPEPDVLPGSDVALKVADDVYVLGYPVGRNLSVTKGIVSAFTKDDYDDRQYIQTDAPISPGHSGGPLLDRCGRVVGMTTQTLRGAENVGYAIAWSQLSKRIAEMTESASKASPEEREQQYPSEQAEVVARYYTLLSGGDLASAYGSFTESRKRRLPYDNWAKGLSRTVFVRLATVTQSEKSNTVNVHFYATEEDEMDAYEWRTGEFEGTWTLVREGGLWKMSDSNIKDITKPATQ